MNEEQTLVVIAILERNLAETRLHLEVLKNNPDFIPNHYKWLQTIERTVPEVLELLKKGAEG